MACLVNDWCQQIVECGSRFIHLQVEYNNYIVVAALRFYSHLARLKNQPLQNQLPQPAKPLPELKAAPGQPVTLSERVFHAFAQQNMPVYKPLSLPVTRLKLSCPGEQPHAAS